MRLFLCLFFVLFSIQSQAVNLTRLGQRSSSCQKLDGDDFIAEIAPQLKREAKNLFDDDKLSTVLLPNANCFRVGTEIRLLLKNETIPYLGRGLIQSIELVKASELQKIKLPYSKSSIDDFIKSNRAIRYAVLRIKVTEKVEETKLDEQFARLPTCFPSYGDWKSMRLKEGDEALLKRIQTGRQSAQIWNGTFNCYKVGVWTDITLPNSTEGHGFIFPTELHIVHYTNLNHTHARMLGTSLSSLKQRMAEKKDVEGGYTTMVVFDYAKERPPRPDRLLQ